jgi:nucleoside-diphosphate-sugar epimerase
MSTVLVTGGSGFVGVHSILRLLEDGHQVHTTVRSLRIEEEVRDMLRRGGAEPGERVAFFAADLEKDAGWAEAAKGCEYVLHVASPFPFDNPKHIDALVPAARDGALRVLKASRDAGVKRVVQTSSFAAIGYGHPPRDKPFDETDWTDLNGRDITPYVKSKTVAERAAWDFIAREGSALELSVINPVGIFGPALGRKLSTTPLIIRQLLNGKIPGAPRISLGVVDVRDIADLHVLAMTSPAAKGERFLGVAGEFMWLHDIAMILKRRLGPAARRVPSAQLPDWAIKAGGVFDRNARLAVAELGHAKQATSEKAKRLLGWSPRPPEEAIVSCGQSLIDLGLVKG